MKTRIQAAVGLFAGVWVWSALPASGQITSVVDERGKRVFVNAETPALRTTGRPKASGRPAAPSPAPQRPGTARFQQVPKEGLQRMAREAAERHNVDPALVLAVIEAESSWNTSAVSSKGAQGLMQLVPATAERHGVNDVFDPEQNLEAGVRHLRMLLERYNGDLDRALAAYNAGEGAVDRARGVPNYPETRAYVRKITDSYFQPGSGRAPTVWTRSRSIYRVVDEQGRVVYLNE